MRPPVDDIENRLPVWEACSDLYLDVQLFDSDHKRIGAICAQSAYSSDELDIIMFSEMWPAFCTNLMSPAGEWTGWNQETIVEYVLESYSPRWRIPWKLNPLKRFYFHDVWPGIQETVTTLRAR